MERRANAILNGRKRSTFLSTSLSSQNHSTESSSDLKKNRYAFSLLKKGNKQDLEGKVNCSAENQPAFKVSNHTTIREAVVPKSLVEINKSPGSTSQGLTDSDHMESNSSSQPSTPRARSSHRSDDSTTSKCSDCRHKCDNKTHSEMDNQEDFDDDSAILNEILNEGEGSGSESHEGIVHHADSLSSGSDSGFYHARGKLTLLLRIKM